MRIEAIKYGTEYLLNLPYKYYQVNNEPICPTHHSAWALAKTPEIKTVQRYQQGQQINRRYELIEKSLASDKIPEVIFCNDAEKYSEEDEKFLSPYTHLFPLYEYKSDRADDYYGDIEFELVVIEEVPGDYKQKIFKLQYEQSNTHSWNPPVKTLLPSTGNIGVRSALRDSILYPDVLQQEVPCEVNSRTMYAIARHYIKQNIDKRYAYVSSDYDFCFSVKKRIGLFKLEEYLVDVNNSLFQKKKRKEKWEKRYRTHRDVTVFDMTYSPENYKGYTPIGGMKGDNYEDLENKILQFLAELMEEINMPLIDCPHCEGRGVIVKPKE